MAQLRLQHSVLCVRVQDDLVLFRLEPAEKGRDEELPRNRGAESTPIARRGFRTLRLGDYSLPVRRQRSLDISRAAT
jgi:hypothetical protein